MLSVSSDRFTIFKITGSKMDVPEFFNPFTFHRAKSKIDKCSKITNWVKLKNKQHHSKVLLNSFPMVLSIESNIRKLCITQGFTMGGKGLRI